MRHPAALLPLLLALPLTAQAPAGGYLFAPEKDARLEAIKAETTAKPAEPKKNHIWVDFSTVKAPHSLAEFHSVWHQPPVCQGVSGMCWCFATTSFLESEANRLHQVQPQLSTLHSVYWEYVEKAKGFCDSRGSSVFGQGSQTDAALRAFSRHGVVPADQFTGLRPGQKNHNHDPLFKELKTYLDGVKRAGAWNEAEVTATVRAILDHDLGVPPATVAVAGKSLSPSDYLKQVLKVEPADYVTVVSFLGQPYWQKVEYEVPDNWWHGKDYLNVPLDDFMAAFKGALRAGYSLVVALDMSEPGYSIGGPGLAVVPDWDIPADHIDARARALRFDNGTTTDDHDMHVVGYTTQDGKDWFLVKDSWSSAWNSEHPGYYFISEDYIKLKALTFTLHKSAVQPLLARFKD
jgi:bleomycin hydrolase